MWPRYSSCMTNSPGSKHSLNKVWSKSRVADHAWVLGSHTSTSFKKPDLQKIARRTDLRLLQSRNRLHLSDSLNLGAGLCTSYLPEIQDGYPKIGTSFQTKIANISKTTQAFFFVEEYSTISISTGFGSFLISNSKQHQTLHLCLTPPLTFRKFWKARPITIHPQLPNRMQRQGVFFHHYQNKGSPRTQKQTASWKNQMCPVWIMWGLVKILGSSNGHS